MEAVCKAKEAHNRSCPYGGNATEVHLSWFDIERMGWEDGDVICGLVVVGGEAELLCLRARDPDDEEGTGELRVWLRHDRTWLPGRDGARGRWSTRSRAVLDCWGEGGRGVRCVLDAPGLLRLLDALVADG